MFKQDLIVLCSDITISMFCDFGHWSRGNICHSHTVGAKVWDPNADKEGRLVEFRDLLISSWKQKRGKDQNELQIGKNKSKEGRRKV